MNSPEEARKNIIDTAWSNFITIIRKDGDKWFTVVSLSQGKHEKWERFLDFCHILRGELSIPKNKFSISKCEISLDASTLNDDILKELQKVFPQLDRKQKFCCKYYSVRQLPKISLLGPIIVLDSYKWKKKYSIYFMMYTSSIPRNQRLYFVDSKGNRKLKNLCDNEYFIKVS